MPAELVPYTPFTGRFFPAGKTVIPAHLQQSYRYLFDRLEQQLPFAKSINRLAENMGFGNYTDFSKRLTAEQADSVLLATMALSAGQTFTVADQTGIGKGRILAGIVRFALTERRKVIFISENHNLFVDFWRDLFDLQTHLMLPGKQVFMLCGAKLEITHPQVKNSVYCRTPTRKQGEKWVEEKNTDFLCVMTTFSQLAGKAGQARLDYLCEFAQDAYVIMDESHNTIGASSGVRDALEQAALGVVYSSATMISKAEHLRHILPRLNLDTKQLPENFIGHLSGYESVYADFIGRTLVRNGSMVRREHSYQMPHTLSYADDATEERIHSNLLNIGFFINSVLALHIKLQLKNTHATTPQHIQQVLKKTVSRFWKTNGHRISLLVRHVLLLNMVDFAVSRTAVQLAEGKKVVLVLNSTLSSLIEELYQTQKANGHTCFYFTLHKALYGFIHDFTEEFGQDIWQQAFFQEECGKLQNIMAGIPNHPLSVIDSLKSKIAEKTGQTVLEISGRENCVYTQADGSYDWRKRSDETDPNIIREWFNNGKDGRDYDVVILTNAGSTGLSLHAGKTFKNQKQRHMIELEINPNTIEREQMHGRINRTGQVVLPTLETLMSHHLTAMRLLNRETDKTAVARSLVSSGKETADALLLSEPTEWAARHFLCKNADVCERIPIKPNHTRTDCNDFPVLNRLLSRAFFLEQDEHRELRDMLLAAQEINRHSLHLHETVRTLRYQDISNIKATRLFSCGKLHDGNPRQATPVRDRLKMGTPELLLCRIDCSPKLNAAPTGEHDDHAAKRHKKLFTHVRFFAEKTVADEQDRATMQRNLALIQKLTYGDEVSFVLDGCNMKGVVVDAQINEQYPYPEFQAVGLRLQPNSSDAVIVWENDVFLPLNYLVSNAALRLNSLEELLPSLEQTDGHRFYALLGHPLLQAWLLSIYQNKLGRGSFVSDDGEAHPMLIVPKEKVDDVRSLFTAHTPVLNEEQLQEILYGQAAVLCNADQSLNCTLTDKKRGIIRIERDKLALLLGEKAQAKLAAYDANNASYMGKAYWEYDVPAATVQSVMFSYFYSPRSQLFVQAAT